MLLNRTRLVGAWASRFFTQASGFVLATLLLGGSLGAAHGQGSSSGGTSFTPVTQECQPGTCFASTQARQNYARRNNCYFLEDVCDAEGSRGQEQGALAQAQSFVEGLIDGLGDQLEEIVELISGPIEAFNAARALVEAFVADPQGTIAALASLAGEGINQLIIQATQCGAYDLGKVIGQNVSPVAVLKVGVRLARFGGNIGDAVRHTRVELGCASFVAGTPVLLAEGPEVQASTVPIERIAIGQLVRSRSDQLWTDAPQKVENTFGRVAPNYWELRTEHELYRLTEEHPVWVQGKGWTATKEVSEEDVLATEQGDAVVRSNRLVDQSIRVFNFSVANTPSYFVGERGLWVHNATCGILPGGGLRAHEGRGHTLRDHVNVTTDDLRDRANSRGAYAGRTAPSLSSRYTDQATAESAVLAVMTDRQVAIQAWLNDPRSPATEGFNTSFTRPVGEGVPSGSETAQSLSTARVVLRKDPSAPGGYFILTSYPVEP